MRVSVIIDWRVCRLVLKNTDWVIFSLCNKSPKDDFPCVGSRRNDDREGEIVCYLYFVCCMVFRLVFVGDRKLFSRCVLLAVLLTLLLDGLTTHATG